MCQKYFFEKIVTKADDCRHNYKNRQISQHSKRYNSKYEAIKKPPENINFS
jgi:hypothetical protein